MSKRLDLLTREFKKTCKNDKEAEASALLAINLGNVFPYERSSELKEDFLSQIRPKTYIRIPHSHRFLFFSVLVAVLLFGAVWGVVESNPGETLYPVKVLSSQMYKIFIKPSVKEISKSSETNAAHNSKSNKSVKREKPSPEEALPRINKPPVVRRTTLGNNSSDNNGKSDNKGVIQSVKENVDDVADQTTTGAKNVIDQVKNTVNEALDIIPPKLGL